jgi:GTPase SAR1 family protein
VSRLVVLWVVGPPGAGKTSLVRALMDHLDPGQTRYLVDKPKWTVAPGLFAAAGHYTGSTFDGADTVPYNGVAAALSSWADGSAFGTPCGPTPPLTILDGDRFSHETAARFFDRSSVGGAGRGLGGAVCPGACL